MKMQRDTRQRRAIRQVMDASDRPLRPDEILAASRRLIPGIGQATVYRALQVMLQDRRVVPVEIPGHPPCYEKAGLKHHHHFSCTGCGRVFELPGCSVRPAKGVPSGFQVEGHDLVLYGRCRDCRQDG